MNNIGASSSNDGRAPVAISDYNLQAGNGARLVTAITGVFDQAFATCLAKLIADPAVPKVPSAVDAEAENRKAMMALRGSASTVAPSPFIAAMSVQESGGRHFYVPSGQNEDNFVVLGLDRNEPTTAPDRITSRGYGLGQFTIFHHPPGPRRWWTSSSIQCAMCSAHFRN